MTDHCYVVVKYWANVDERMNRSAWAGVYAVFRALAAAEHYARLPDYAPAKRRTAVWSVTPGQASGLLAHDFQRGAQFLALCDAIGVVLPEVLR